MPLTLEEYMQRLHLEFDLNLNNFCIYQGKLEDILFTQDESRGGLLQIFEELSGSLEFRPKSDDLKQKISDCDEQLKRETEALQTLRLEKVKQKGLQEFAESLKECLTE